jgi:ABC transporter substrate binding protein
VKKRTFIAALGSAAAWPMVARGQGSMPVVAFIDSGDSNGHAAYAVAFRNGLNETGFVDGTNVTIEIHWLEGKFDRLSALMAELVGRQVAAIASATPGALAAKAATSTIPIVFASGGDPVKLGLVASLNRPGGNVTGVSFLGGLMESKRLVCSTRWFLKSTLSQCSWTRAFHLSTPNRENSITRRTPSGCGSLSTVPATVVISTQPSHPSEKRRPEHCSLHQTHFSTQSVKRSPLRPPDICSLRSPMGVSLLRLED